MWPQGGVDVGERRFRVLARRIDGECLLEMPSRVGRDVRAARRRARD